MAQKWRQKQDLTKFNPYKKIKEEEKSTESGLCRNRANRTHTDIEEETYYGNGLRGYGEHKVPQYVACYRGLVPQSKGPETRQTTVPVQGCRSKLGLGGKGSREVLLA